MATTDPNAGKIKLEDVIFPTEQYMSAVAEVYDKYYKWKIVNTNTWPQLKGQKIIDYVKSSRNKMYGYTPVSSEYTLTGRKVFLTHEFRNQAEKILTFIANLAQNPKFTGTEGLDFQIATLLNGLHKFVTRGTAYKISTLLHYWHVVMDGTAIVYVSYAPFKSVRRDISELDLTTGAMTFTEAPHLKQEIEETLVDITDFYFPKIFEPDLQKQGECIWRSVMTWQDFKNYYKFYPLADKVVPGSMLVTDSLFARLLDKTMLVSDKIEVIKYFDALRDRYILIANGVWINPVGVNKDQVSPLPWSHKQLPFAKTIYRFIDGNFFYGASLPQLVTSPVEAKENLIEMTLDRIFKAINPPILSRDPQVKNGMKLVSGNVYHVNSDPVNDWRELAMGEIDPNAWTMGQQLDAITNNVATPITAQTQTSVQPKSAAENRIAQEQQQQNFNFQKLFYQDLLEQKGWLSVWNALQFYTAGDIAKMVGQKKYQGIFNMQNVHTPSGNSTLEVRFVKTNQELSKVSDLMNEKLLRAIQRKEKVEIIEVSNEIIEDLQFEVEVSFDFEDTPELKKAIFMDFMQFLVQAFPDMIDRKKLLFRAFEVWNENPADYIPDEVVKDFPAYLAGSYKTQQQTQQQQMVNGLPQPPGGLGGAPGAAGGAPPMPAMQAIKQSMLRGPASGRGNTARGNGAAASMMH